MVGGVGGREASSHEMNVQILNFSKSNITTISKDFVTRNSPPLLKIEKLNNKKKPFKYKKSLVMQRNGSCPSSIIIYIY